MKFLSCCSPPAMACFLMSCHVTQTLFSGGFPQCSLGYMRKVGWARRRWPAPSTAAWAPCWWSLWATHPDSCRRSSRRKTPGSWARCFTSRLVSKRVLTQKIKVFLLGTRFCDHWSVSDRSGAGGCPQPETKSASRGKQRRCRAGGCTKWHHTAEEDQSGCSHLWYRWDIWNEEVFWFVFAQWKQVLIGKVISSSRVSPPLLSKSVSVHVLTTRGRPHLALFKQEVISLVNSWNFIIMANVLDSFICNMC